MDTSGFSQIGRYGTLSLLKRRPTGTTNAPTPTNDTITSFGIDSNELTFGSSSTCSVRLYYPDVDSLHCKIVFEDGKAFLAVLGKEGVLVDGCWVYPHTSSGKSPSTSEQSQQQTLIPVANNSEFEIHNKRFKFTYPPKEMRKSVLATPAPIHKRALRLSMIHSAQVFSPRPSKDPRENLRILQSPLKGIFGTKTPIKAPGMSPTRTRAVSPLKYGTSRADSDEETENKEEPERPEDETASDDDDEEEIILVQTNHPRVVEEERDLVILEDVLLAPDNAPVPQVPAQPQAQTAAAPQPPRTPPRRKSIGGTALHRAVLIRSAQRAVWRAEKEREEEEEELEVLSAVVDPLEVGDESDEEEGSDEDEEGGRWEDNDVEMRSVSSEGEETDEEDDEEAKRREEQKPLWRKSLERIIPWSFTDKTGEDQDDESAQDNLPEVESHDAQYQEEEEQTRAEDKDDNENEILAPLPARPPQTPMRRILGSFMTPQPEQYNQATRNAFPQTQIRPNMLPPALPQALPVAAPLPVPGAGRYSLGGGEARRVVVQQPWKVKDLVLPPLVPAASTASGSNASPVRPLAGPGASMPPPSTPLRSGGGGPRATPVVTEAERRAIQERRRSAVLEVKADTFWKDGAPGMSPAKGSARSGATFSAGNDGRSRSTSPVKHGLGAMHISEERAARAQATPKTSIFTSPTKGRALGYAIAEEDDSTSLDDKSRRYQAEAAARDSEDAEEEDTHSLLERMRSTVEDMKRRRSMVVSTPRIESTPATIEPALAPASVAAPTPIRSSAALTTPVRATGAAFTMGSVKKLDFSRITPGPRVGSVKPPSRTKSPAPALATAARSDGEEEQEEPFSLLRPGLRDTPSGSSARKLLLENRDSRVNAEVQGTEQQEVVDVPLPVVVIATDGIEEEEEEHTRPKAAKAKGRGRSRVLPASEEVEVEIEIDKVSDGQAEEVPPLKPTSKAAPKPRSRSARSPPPVTLEPTPAPTLAPAARRGRSKTPQPIQVENDVDSAATKPAASKRSRKGTAEPEESTPAPARRGRKAAAEPIEEEPAVEAEAEPAASEEKTTKIPTVKRGRKPRVVPAVIEEEPQEAEAALAPAKRSRTKKATVAAPVASPQQDDEDDLLDTHPAASGSQTENSNPVKAPSRGRKKAAVVKQEPVEDGQETDEPTPLVATRGGRGAKANTNATVKTPAVKTPASTTAAAAGKTTRPRGRPKTPASAPAAATETRIPSGAAATAPNSEKENTPGAGSGSGVSDEVEDAPVRIRVSRKTAAAAAAGSGRTSKVATKSAAKSTSKTKVKTEQHEEQAEDVGPAKGRITRVMRTRTKTS